MARTSNGRGRGRVGAQPSQKPNPPNPHITMNTNTPPASKSNDSSPSQTPSTTTPTNHIPVYRGPMASDASHGIGKQLRLDSGGNLRELSSSPTSIPTTANPPTANPPTANPSTSILHTKNQSTANPSQPVGPKGRCRISVTQNSRRFIPTVKIPWVTGAVGSQSASGGHSASGGGESSSGGRGESVRMSKGQGTKNQLSGQGRGLPGGQETSASVLGKGKQSVSMGQVRAGTTLPFGRGRESTGLQMGRGKEMQRGGSLGNVRASVPIGSGDLGASLPSIVEGRGPSSEGRESQRFEGRGGASEGRASASRQGTVNPSGQGGQQTLVEGSGSHNEEPPVLVQQRQDNANQNHEPQTEVVANQEVVGNHSDIRESQESETSGRSKKLYIWLENGRTILPSEEASDVISKIFTKRLDETGYNWKGVTQATKDIYFQEFLKNVEYDHGLESALYGPWKSKAGVRYKDFVSKHKDRQEEWMSNDVWDGWNKYWETDEFKTKSLIGKQNRLGKDKKPSKHIAGSVTFRKHWERMNVEQKRTVSAPEMYISTHKQKETDAYVDDKAKTYGEELETRLSQIDPTLSEEELLKLKNQIYLEVVGPPRKGRYYGTDPVILGEVAGTSALTANSHASSHENELRLRLEEVEAKERENAQEVLRLKKLNSTLRSKLPGFIRQMVNKAIHETYDTAEGDAQMGEEGEKADENLDKAFDDMMIDEEAYAEDGADATANQEDNGGSQDLNDWDQEHLDDM